MIKRQSFFPGKISAQSVSLISAMGVDRLEGSSRHHPAWSCQRQGRSWAWRHISRGDTFLLVADEAGHTRSESIAYTKWEDYIKVNFWLGGKLTTVLDGFGEQDHDRPKVFILSCPRDTIKVDLVSPSNWSAGVALCVQRDFFPVHMGLSWDQLPDPLRDLLIPPQRPYGFYQLPLTSDLAAATRGILNAPLSVRSEPLYARAKAVEMMCLLLHQLNSGGQRPADPRNRRARRDSRLHQAREILSRRYAESLTLGQISREVGLNRMSLTTGFRELFGLSVHDYLTRERMERAYELLQGRTHTVAQVAEAVGYSHSCTFSTAFHAFFGYSPRKARLQN